MSDVLQTLARFRDLPEALLAKGRLESAGIDCFLADGNTVRTNWLWSNAIGGMRLQVRAEDFRAAVEVLEEPTPEGFSADEVGEEYEQPRCPRCSSLDIGFETINHFWTYGIWMVLGLPIPIRKKNWKCYSCLAEWVEE